jgi:hypothetical protein
MYHYHTPIFNPHVLVPVVCSDVELSDPPHGFSRPWVVTIRMVAYF